MSKKILQVLKTSYPSESSNLGSVTIKIILYKKNEEFGCSVGEGEPEWVVDNGRVLDFNEAYTFFKSIEGMESVWMPKK
jgi:hypothetical protein